MSPKPTMRAVLIALLLQPIQAQFSNWADDQINTTICTWTEPRGIVLPVDYHHGILSPLLTMDRSGSHSE